MFIENNILFSGTKEKLNGTLPPAIHSSLMLSFGTLVTMNTQLSSRIDLWQRKRIEKGEEEGGEEGEEEGEEEKGEEEEGKERR